MTLSCGFMIKYAVNSSNGNRQDKRSARCFKKVCAIAIMSYRRATDFRHEPHPSDSSVRAAAFLP